MTIALRQLFDLWLKTKLSDTNIAEAKESFDNFDRVFMRGKLFDDDAPAIVDIEAISQAIDELDRIRSDSSSAMSEGFRREVTERFRPSADLALAFLKEVVIHLEDIFVPRSDAQAPVEQHNDELISVDTPDEVITGSSTDGVSEKVDEYVEPAKPVIQNLSDDNKTIAFTIQEGIIHAPLDVRIIINGGPGTGKTWALIERIIWLLSDDGGADPSEMLVLCFSRAAVEVVRSRLRAACYEGRLDFDLNELEVRTFDSFATYVISQVRDNDSTLLSPNFALDKAGYDDRIKEATLIFEKKPDILSNYRHIFVDEVQDLVGVRAQFVLKIMGYLDFESGFTISGDSCQSVFDYQAKKDPSIMTSRSFFNKMHALSPNMIYHELKDNYRQSGSETISMLSEYRKAILNTNHTQMEAALEKVMASIKPFGAELWRIDGELAAKYTDRGTLGILTKTNAQALQVSAWLRTNGVLHNLLNGRDDQQLGDWIAKIFCEYDKPSIDESTFFDEHRELFPELDDEDLIQTRWEAIANTQEHPGNSRFEVRDILIGISQNAKDPVLCRSNGEMDYKITVSTVHKAKGKEFDSVVVIDKVFEPWYDESERDALSEYKANYVALTRFKDSVYIAQLEEEYIKTLKWYDKRCYKLVYFRTGKRYVSHIEIGNRQDINDYEIGYGAEFQSNLRSHVTEGSTLYLRLLPDNITPVRYGIYTCNGEVPLGITSEYFTDHLDAALRDAFGLHRSRDIYYDKYPDILSDIYIDKVTSVISNTPPFPPAAKVYQDVAIWSGFRMAGFASTPVNT